MSFPSICVHRKDMTRNQTFAFYFLLPSLPGSYWCYVNTKDKPSRLSWRIRLWGQWRLEGCCCWWRKVENAHLFYIMCILYSWSTTSGVWKHFNATHATDEDLVFHCEYCAAKFPNKNLLNYHRKTKHLTR